MCVSENQVLYNVTTAQVFSTCGRFLFVGNQYGDIFIYSVVDLESPSYESKYSSENTRKSSDPVQVYAVGNDLPIQSLAFFKEFLIVGTLGRLIGYNWNENSQKVDGKAWEIKLPTSPKSIEVAEINSMWLDVDNEHLFAGCGDNEMYSIDLESGTVIRSYSGHKDYIHCVTGSESNIYSASEDGQIKIWDSRKKTEANKIEPHKTIELARPQFGKWQGSVSVTDDWLVCGGGPKLSLWYLRTMECTNSFPFPEKVHVTDFIDETVLVGGGCNRIYQFNLNQTLTAEIPVAASSIYSVVWRTEPHKMLSIGGASNEIDLCTNFSYRDITLRLYKNSRKLSTEIK